MTEAKEGELREEREGFLKKSLDILLKNQPKESKEDKIKTNGRSATPGRSLRAPAGKSSALETTQSMKKVAK